MRSFTPPATSAGQWRPSSVKKLLPKRAGSGGSARAPATIPAPGRASSGTCGSRRNKQDCGSTLAELECRASIHGFWPCRSRLVRSDYRLRSTRSLTRRTRGEHHCVGRINAAWSAGKLRNSAVFVEGEEWWVSLLLNPPYALPLLSCVAANYASLIRSTAYF